MVIFNKTSLNCLLTSYPQITNRVATAYRQSYETKNALYLSSFSQLCVRKTFSTLFILQPMENTCDMIGFQNQWQRQISCAVCHTCQVTVSMKKRSLNESCPLGHHVDYQPRKDLGLLLTDRIRPNLRCV